MATAVQDTPVITDVNDGDVAVHVRLSKLKEQYLRCHKAAEAFVDDNTGEWSAEDQAQYDKMSAELDHLERQLEVAHRERDMSLKFDDIDAEQREQHGKSEDEYNAIFEKWMRQGDMALTAEDHEVLNAAVKDNEEAFTLQQSTGGGSKLVPVGFRNKLIEVQKTFMPLIEVVDVLTTSTGNTIHQPMEDDTAQEGEWLGENVTNTDGEPVYSDISFGAHDGSSKRVPVSNNLLNDNAINLESRLATLLGRRLGRLLNNALSTGDGTGKPTGLTHTANAGTDFTVKIASGAINDTGVKNLLAAPEQLDEAYEDSSILVVNRPFKTALRQLRGTDGYPLLMENYADGRISTFLGYPIRTNTGFGSAALAAAQKVGVFGDLMEGYTARVVQDLVLIRDPWNSVQTRVTNFMAFQRYDGRPTNRSAYAILTTN